MKDVLESFRRRTREEFCAHLRAIGIDAQLSGEGETTMELLINIRGEAIQWIRIQKEATGGGDSPSVAYYTCYEVPDPRLFEKLYRFTISTVRVKNFPIFGKVVDLRWKGNDCGLGIIDQLQGDMSIRQAIMKSGDITIDAGAYGEWTIRPTMRNSLIPPSKEEWNCYQAIARHLLAMKL